MLGGKATPGCEQALSALGYEAPEGDLVGIVQKPFHPRLSAGMQLDRPGRAGYAILELGAPNHVLVHQRSDPANLTGLAHPDLHAGVVDEGLLAAREVIAEEAGIFAHLPPALALRIAEIAPEQSVQLTSVGAKDARAIA